MTTHRRDFLKSASLGAVALSAGAALASCRAQPEAAAADAPFEFAMPRNMTLLNMRSDLGPRLGVKTERGILNVAAAAERFNLRAPVDTDDLLQNGKGGLLAEVVGAAANGPEELFLDEADVLFAPAVTRPEKIIMMGFNYRRHAAETNTPIPRNPVLFNKFNNTLNHHGGTIRLPTAVARNFDYEVELVMVFGRPCKNVTEEEALDYIAGYCTGNDFSARDLQTLTTQLMIGKSHDGFGPLGPYLVTSDHVGDPKNLRIETGAKWATGSYVAFA